MANEKWKTNYKIPNPEFRDWDNQSWIAIRTVDWRRKRACWRSVLTEKRKRRTREAPSRRGYRQRYLYNNRCFDHRRRPFDTLQRQNNDECVQGALTRCAMSAAAHRRRVSRCRGLSLRLTADRRVRNETDLYDLRGTFPWRGNWHGVNISMPNCALYRSGSKLLLICRIYWYHSYRHVSLKMYKFHSYYNSFIFLVLICFVFMFIEYATDRQVFLREDRRCRMSEHHTGVQSWSE